MTEAQRVGQLFLVGLVGDPVSEVTRAVAAYHFGSWLLGASQVGVTGTGQVTHAVQALASSRATGKVRSFQAAIEAGVPFAMVALATYTRIDPRHLAVFSPQVMRVMLRRQMRFRGVIVSDDLGVAAAVASISPAARGIGFLDAGGDLITSQSLAPAVAMDRAILDRAAADPAFRAVVNAAVMRVLSAKQAYRLLPCPRP